MGAGSLPVSQLPYTIAEVIDMQHHTHIVPERWGPDLRSSCLHSRTNCTIAPAPFISLFLFFSLFFCWEGTKAPFHDAKHMFYQWATYQFVPFFLNLITGLISSWILNWQLLSESYLLFPHSFHHLSHLLSSLSTYKLTTGDFLSHKGSVGLKLRMLTWLQW